MVANISQKYKECPKESLIKTKEKLHKTINPHNLKVMRIYLFVISDSYLSYFTSSKTTLTDYQCVSTGCCTHVAKTEITIDNQYVTKSLQRYKFLPKQPKENTEKKITNLPIFLDLDWLWNAEMATKRRMEQDTWKLFLYSFSWLTDASSSVEIKGVTLSTLSYSPSLVKRYFILRLTIGYLSGLKNNFGPHIAVNKEY